MMNDTAMDTSTVRSSPVSDGQQSRRTAVGKRHGLQHKLRMWPKKRVKTRLRIYSLNVGTMIGNSRELAEMLDRRIIDTACVQKTKWKFSKAREIGHGYKLFYHLEKTSRNGVRIIVSQKWKDNILAVNRVSDRLMSTQLVTKKGRLISAYAPHIVFTGQNNDLFCEELHEMIQPIPDTEHVSMAGDLSGHIGTNRQGFERWHGGNGYGQLTEEGRVIMQRAHMFDLAVCPHV